MTQTSTTTTPAASYVPRVGDYVVKGSGATVYRVWAVTSDAASVVKATTVIVETPRGQS